MKTLGIILLGSLISFSTESQACDSERHSDFDFWLGEWEVTLVDGKSAGINRITKEQNGCLIEENWTSAQPGFTGTSVNFFHPQKQHWQQLWIDSGGNVLELTGGLKANAMVLRSQILEKDGKAFIHEITWTPNADGTVRQVWQSIPEDSEVVTIFDGLYKKKLKQ